MSLCPCLLRVNINGRPPFWTIGGFDGEDWHDEQGLILKNVTHYSILPDVVYPGECGYDHVAALFSFGAANE